MVGGKTSLARTRKRLNAKRLLCGLVLCLCWVCTEPAHSAAAGQLQEATREQAQEQVQARPGIENQSKMRLDDLQALKLADSLAAANRLEEAGQIYMLLLESPLPELRVEALFKLGNIHMLRRDYERAAACYLAILNSYPELVRVRLELACAYFADEDYEKADFHFRLVLGDKDLPEEVVEKVNLFLTAIRRQKNWALSGSVGFAPDSNLNQASGETRECVQTNYGLLCRKVPDKESGLGFKASLYGTHYLKLSKNFGLKSEAGLAVLDFKESDFDDNSFSLASGPRLVFPGGEVSLQPTFSYRWVGGKDYSHSWGGKMNFSYDLNDRLNLSAGLAVEFNQYANSTVNALLQGHTLSGWLDLRRILSNKSMLIAGGRYTAERTNSPAYDNDTWGASLGYYREFPLAFTAYAELSYSQVSYRASSWFIRSDGFIEDKTRKDHVYQGYLRLANRYWEAEGFTPSISYLYTNRRSNAWNHDYDKHRVEFSIRQNF